MYHRILVPVDGSPTSTAGLHEALRMARCTQARLDLVHVVDELSIALGIDLGGTSMADWIAKLKQAGRKVIDDAIAITGAAGITCDSCLIETLSGGVPHAVLREAAEWHADLIVLGTHGRRGLGRLLLGSDAEQILRASPVPVLLVRGAPVAAAKAEDREPIASPA